MLKPPFHNSFKADVLDLAPIIIAVHDTDYNIVWANKAYQKATGLRLKEIEGRKCFSAWGLAKPCHGCPVLTTIETGKQQEAELTPQNQDHWPMSQGSWLSRAVPVRDASGNIIGAIETAYEITDQKQTEKKLKKKTLDLFERVKELNCLYGISRLDETPDISLDELIRGIVDLVSLSMGHPENIFSRILLDGKEYKTNNFKEAKLKLSSDIFLDDKRIGALEVYQLEGKSEIDEGPSIKEEKKLITAIAERLGKIIERYQSNKNRKNLQKQLDHAMQMESIGNLAGGIAHDFNNILSSIIGFTELALDEVERGTTIEDSLQEVYAAGKRAKDLVKQILAFARQSDEEIMPIQPGEIAKEVLKFIRSSIPSTIEIKENIESDSLIMANQTHIHQVLMNLCTNAAYAMGDEGGSLDLCLKDITIDRTRIREMLQFKHGDYIEIKVSDTGTGIPPEIINFIFDPYFTTKGSGEGTGMGLAMVHGIVEVYGGKITVDSRLGAGTTFTVYLPITRKRQEHRPYEPGDLPSGTERILFVDDEASIANMGSQILERLGYQVAVRTSSVEALELFRTKPNDFNLVITDMTMPNMTGDRLAIELMKIRPDIPVILCTGYSKKISGEMASDIGIKALAYKPIVTADLAKTVRKVLDGAKTKSCT